jgi:hypothetical protein
MTRIEMIKAKIASTTTTTTTRKAEILNRYRDMGRTWLSPKYGETLSCFFFNGMPNERDPMFKEIAVATIAIVGEELKQTEGFKYFSFTMPIQGMKEFVDHNNSNLAELYRSTYNDICEVYELMIEETYGDPEEFKQMESEFFKKKEVEDDTKALDIKAKLAAIRAKK